MVHGVVFSVVLGGCGLYGMVIQTQRSRLIGAPVAPYSLIFQVLPGIRLKLEHVLVLILVLTISADNLCYQRDIMSTHRRGGLWMAL